MKKIALYILVAVLLAACAKETAPVSAPETPAGNDLITWTFTASQTKASIADDGSFSWSKGDQIALWDAASGAYVTFTDPVGKGVFTAEASRSANFTRAVYPASIATGMNAITLPASYTQAEAAQGRTFPMAAEVSAESNVLKFKHLGAILRLRLDDVLPTMTQVTVTATEGSISGTFPASEVYFEDDFSWLKGSVDAYQAANPSSKLDPVGSNDLGSTACLKYADNGFGTAFEASGYEQLNSLETPAIYAQKYYLKFGRDKNQNGLKLPAIAALGAEGKDVTFAFDWCAHVQGSGKVDEVSLVVELSGDGVCADTGEKVSGVLTTTQSGVFAWQHAVVRLSGVTSSTRISIRPAAPGFTQSGQHRFHLDNILVTGAASGFHPGSGHAGVTVPFSLTEKGSVLVSLPMPVGSYAYTITVGNSEDPAVFTASTQGAQNFERAKIYNLGGLDFYRGHVLLEAGVEGESFTEVADNPYVWQ